MARIHLGLQECLYIGNLGALRDWGHAKDYAQMQWLMLQQDAPDDFVIATGEQHSVKEFVELTAKELGIAIQWQGEGISEKGINMANGKTIVAVDPMYFRPTEVDALLGDPTKAKKKLGWESKTTFEQLVKDMVQADLETAKRDDLCRKAGFRINHRRE
jgi:GDPmannose 4,6-dehydratase